MQFGLLSLLLGSALAAPAASGSGYIVRLADGTPLESILSSLPDLSSAGVRPFSIINGFALPSEAAPLVAVLKLLPGVLSIEDDITMFASATQSNAPWGLQRISTQSRVASTTGTPNEKLPAYTYTYNENFAGQGVDVYVVDTGIRCSHSAFEGRALCPSDGNLFDGGVNVDDNGHGTHCAGTVGSSLYGVSKKVQLVGVKVLGADGSGATSNIILGIQYAVERSQASGKNSVISMSLGGGASSALDAAVKAATTNGVHVAVAAGNENQDANNVSPARAGLNSAVVCVGAHDITDARASFSNYGTPVTVFGPGVNTLSTWFRSDTDSNVISGTSMATPHTAGVLAYYLSDPSYSAFSPAELKQVLVGKSQKGVIALGKTKGLLGLFAEEVSKTTVNNLLQL
ncbi:peptidase S8/S53 domain-containing protein [Protomyces lactucae-debilis]|uniref:Peptidase S8/S53 domain-containing protein n=1 Tax=Protomyces lactucae-debilis TaxID=2754530 RepID=A0A1Y2FHZ5_PROLT|nr:peptidase S8/S53 domain-containing protein [Protomyces lactucae-debilis]ORY83227.1 peptidase S8/S53 domain-containing protein [Protomyces lactucae-debilis]